MKEVVAVALVALMMTAGMMATADGVRSDAARYQAEVTPDPTCAAELEFCEAQNYNLDRLIRRCEEMGQALVATATASTAMSATQIARLERRVEVAESGWRQCLDYCQATATAEARVWSASLPLVVRGW